MFVQAELEVHSRHREIVAASRELQIKWTYPLSLRLEQAKHRLRIAIDIGRADEAPHRPPHGQHSRLRTDRSRSSFAVRKLLTMPDRAERNIVRHDHADRRFDLLRRRSED